MAASWCWRATSRPTGLDQLDDRMRDEIQGGVIAQMDLPERCLRREILRAKADAVATSVPDAEFEFTDEWVDLLADRLPASGRALHGAVRNVYVGTVLAGQPLSKAAVEKAIQLQLGSRRAARAQDRHDQGRHCQGLRRHQAGPGIELPQAPVRPAAPIRHVSGPPADQMLLPADRPDVRGSRSHHGFVRIPQNLGDGGRATRPWPRNSASSNSASSPIRGQQPLIHRRQPFQPVRKRLGAGWG